MTNRELAARLGGVLLGDERPVITLAAADAPVAGAVVVALDNDTATTLGAAAAPLAALVVAETLSITVVPCPLIRVRDVRLALAQLSMLFDRRPRQAAGVHPLAAVAEDAELGAGASVGALAVLGAGVRIGSGTTIEPGCVLGPGVVVGTDCRLHANVTLYDGVRLGDRVTLHSGVSIGQDGFGYAPGRQGAVKIHHLAGVEIGDDVEIGAGTVVDRGTLNPTRIGARSKVGNLCLIAHNAHIGSDCLLTGAIALGGSVRLGHGVMIGGGAVVRDHVSLGDGARLAAHSGLGKDVPAGETWGGSPARPYRAWVRGLALQNRLEEMWRFVKERS